MPGILFVTYGGGHVAMVVPTIVALRRLGTASVAVMGLTTAEAKLAEAGIPSLGFRHFLETDDDRALAWGHQLCSNMHSSGTSISREESVAYLGLSYADLEQRLGTAEAARQFTQLQRNAFLPITIMRRVLHRLAPELVVVTTSPRAERAAAIAAREMGIPTVMLADGFLDTWDFLTDPHYTDLALVPSEFDQQVLLDAGRASSSVLVTGNPAYDQLAAPELADRGRQWREQQGWQKNRVVLWATSTGISELERQEIWASLAESLELAPSLRLIYRPHPSQGGRAPALPRHYGIVDCQSNIGTLIHAADLVVVENSTVGIEAALSGRPVVKYYLGPHDKTPYHTMGIAIPAFSTAQVGPTVLECLKNPVESLRSPQIRKLLPLVGGAAMRVAQTLQDMLMRVPAQAGSLLRSGSIPRLPSHPFPLPENGRNV